MEFKVGEHVVMKEKSVHYESCIYEITDRRKVDSGYQYKIKFINKAISASLWTHGSYIEKEKSYHRNEQIAKILNDE